MLDIHQTDSMPDTKIYFTRSLLPSYIDPRNVSTKKQPFATFNKQPFTHTLDLVLPSELYPLIHDKLQPLSALPYARVHMKLSDILAPDFLNSYIKQGNISMLSEGRPLVDNRFSLHAGTLHMELDRHTYERCGLDGGTPMEDGGKKHQKQRWQLAFSLSSPSMRHGKKGFGRLEWACKHVLNCSLTWLFYSCHESFGEALGEKREVLSVHAPWVCALETSVGKMEGVLAPRMGAVGEGAGEEVLEVLEWVHLLALESPRVLEADRVNSHLCRYSVPDLGRGVVSRDFVHLRWRGLIVPSLVCDVFLCLRGGQGFKLGKEKKNKGMKGGQDVDMQEAPDNHEDEDKWFSMSAQSFCGKKTWTIMQFDSSRETLTWETEC